MTDSKDNEGGGEGFVGAGRDEASMNSPAYSILPKDRTPSEEILDANKKRDRLRRSFWKNVIVISLAFMMLFMGYYPVSAVQSSLNNEKGLGMAALSAKYGAMAFGNLFTNNYVVDRVGCKWTMSAGMFMYSSYIAANFYPALFTLVPLGILSGFGGAAMWMAQGTYMTRISNDYVALDGLLTADGHTAELSRIKSRVFALFNFLFFGSNAMGNIASSLILPLGGNSNVTDKRLQYCGAAYCNEDLDRVSRNGFVGGGLNVTSPVNYTLEDTRTKPDMTHVYILCTFCFTSALVGVLLLVFFLDTLPSLGISEKVTNSHSILKLVSATVRHWTNPYQLLIIPLGLYNGMDNVFWSAEFTKSFVTCAVGIHFVGFVMVCYGLSSPIFIFIFGWFNKSKLRFVPFLIGLLAQLSVMTVILKWSPRNNDDLIVLFAMSFVWGIGSGVWYPSTYAFISIVFRENMEAAFSNFHLWNNLGSSISYAWSYQLCVHTKVYLLMAVVTIGVIGHLSVELHLHISSKKKKTGVAPMETLSAVIDRTHQPSGKVGITYGSMNVSETKGNE